MAKNMLTDHVFPGSGNRVDFPTRASLARDQFFSGDQASTEHPTLGMALPSSPPLLSDADLPSSPPLPPLGRADRLPILSNRKRQLSHFDNNSSDPLFSDDTSDGGKDGDGRPRQKRMVKGPWWSLNRRRSDRLARSGASKTRYKNVDSGVWMGSDDSVDGLHADMHVAHDPQIVEGATTRPLPSFGSIPGPDAIASQIVQTCVDHGKEMVDLSGLGLQSVSRSILEPLHQLIRHSHVHLIQPPSEDEFMPLTPSIQLFLSSNRLTSLNPELFAFDNITVLSLRSNDLGCIPPAIGRLNKLKELNVAGNRIRYLPWELLDIFSRGGQVTVRPNPLLVPAEIVGQAHSDDSDLEDMTQERQQDDDQNPRMQLEMRFAHGRARRSIEHPPLSLNGVHSVAQDTVIFLAPSAATYFDTDGRPCDASHASNPDDLQAFFPAVFCSPQTPPTNSGNAVPSLFEAALQVVQSQYILDHGSYNSDVFPPGLRHALHKAAVNAAYGNEICSHCSRSYIIARAEWIEYWYIGPGPPAGLTQETVLPFLRRVCSWACMQPTEPGMYRS